MLALKALGVTAGITGSLGLGYYLWEGGQPEESNPPSEPDVPTGAQDLDTNTRRLIDSVLMDLAGLLPSQPSSRSEAHLAMKRLVEEIMEKERPRRTHDELIQVAKTKQEAGVIFMAGESFMATVANMLLRSEINWTRIATLVACGSLVCRQRLEGVEDEQEKRSAVESVGQEISDYLLEHCQEWLKENHAWDGLVDDELFWWERREGRRRLRKIAAGFATVVGLSATFYCARRMW